MRNRKRVCNMRYYYCHIKTHFTLVFIKDGDLNQKDMRRCMTKLMIWALHQAVSQISAV